MTPGHLALAFVSLLVIVNPLALAPIFGALTAETPAARVRRTARVATAAGFALVAAAGLVGHAALRLVGGETALVHLAIGAILLLVGAAMLPGGGAIAPRRAASGRDPALVPLAVPLIAGPGALGAMAAFAAKAAGDPAALAVLYGLLAAVAALTYAAFRAAGPIARRLGARGVRLISRALGLVLAGAGARFLVEGLRGFGFGA